MGLKVDKDFDWREFEAEDDLTNIREGYSFLSEKRFTESKSGLIRAFMTNAVTKSFFTRGINSGMILWKKSNCIE